MSVLDGIGVVGAGGEGRAVAAYLASRGLPVHLYTRDLRAVAGIAGSGRSSRVGCSTGGSRCGR